jgi:predicted AlkP superfamily pyrophosphatase or phosphodiesterase
VRRKKEEGRRKNVVAAVVASAMTVALALPSPRAQQSPSHPRLAVIIVVDQMRADYIDRFKTDWTAGLKRLLTTGASFPQAAFPYLNTVTCPGHATVSTGAFPRLHGIIQNAWYDRASGRVQTCTEDGAVRGIGYDGLSAAPESPAKLLLPSLADEMRRELGSRVVTLSLKARSAIMLAGHGGDAVTWLSDAMDTWQTSSAYAKAPVPAVKAFVSGNPITADYGKTWNRLLPPARYDGPDDGLGETSLRGWTRSFPHLLRGDSSDTRADRDFYEQWQRSPFADAYLGRFAAALVASLELGQRDTIDMLGVSFSTPDLVGHAFGPRSHEVQDIYAHLDGILGALFDRLDALVGVDRWVAAFTSDHGVGEMPEQMAKAGRLNTTRLIEVAERVAQAAGGSGSYVARITGNDLYLRPGMYEKLSTAPAALDAVVNELERQPGVARVFRRDTLVTGSTSADPQLRAASLSYVVGRSGDLVMLPEVGWISAASGTTHGTANTYDQRVPLIFMGSGIKHGEYHEPATPADLAPTLAALVGITMPRAEGHALAPALERGR